MVLDLPLPSGPANVILKVREGANPQADCLAYSRMKESLSLILSLSMEMNNPLFAGQENFLS